MNKMNLDRRACRRECPGITIENQGDEIPNKVDLLGKVLKVCDVWSIRIIGPRDLLRVGHGPDVYEGGGVELGRRGS